MLNALGDLWEHDLALVAQSKIAREHVQAPLDVLGQTEEMLHVREQAATARKMRPATAAAISTAARTRTSGALGHCIGLAPLLLVLLQLLVASRSPAPTRTTSVRKLGGGRSDAATAKSTRTAATEMTFWRSNIAEARGAGAGGDGVQVFHADPSAVRLVDELRKGFSRSCGLETGGAGK